MHRFSCKAFKKRNDSAAHDGLIGEVRERFRDEVVLTESSMRGSARSPRRYVNSEAEGGYSLLLAWAR